MKVTIVRYKVKPERVEENEALIRAVYAELNKIKPEGLRYVTSKMQDGVTFVHFATLTVETNPLLALPAFKEFTSKIAERVDEPPVTSHMTEVGSYNF
jgi:hypothetical protein